MNLSSYHAGGYVFMAGTSMATHSSARPNPLATAARMRGTVVDIGDRGYDKFFGFGMVDAYKALGGR